MDFINGSIRTISGPVVSFSKDGMKKYSIQELEQKVLNWVSLLKTCDIIVLGISSSERSSELIALLHVLVRRKIPFHFLPGTFEASKLPFHMSHVVRFSGHRNEVIKIQDDTHTAFRLDYLGLLEHGGLAYCIQTSGTTGVAKTIAVPWDCIWKNVDDFKRTFEITKDDSILFSTSLLFDPSVIELLLALVTGAKLVIIPDSFRSQPHRLVECIKRARPTVAQFTPAVLSLIDEGNLRWLLGPDSPLRVMLVGGDKFPLDLVKKCRHPQNSTRIFDVYGVTEVSCWATRFEVKHDCAEVFVGEVIDGTSIEVSEESELRIKGSRHCSIDYKPINMDERTKTGDIVEECNGRLRIVGRSDDQLKINGIRCNLSAMSMELIHRVPRVRSARFIQFQEKFLVLFVVSDAPVTMQDVELAVHPMLKPSQIRYLDALPVNNNGKVDVPQLKQLVEADRTAETKKFLQRHHIDIEDPATMMRSFVDFGFDSLLAAELSLLLGSADAMAHILSDRMTISDVLEKYEDTIQCIVKQTSSRVDTKTVSYTSLPMPDIAWAYDTHKCIDGNAAVFSRANDESCVFVASHSGRVAVIELETGKVKLEENHPTRFEASPVFHDGYLILGGYNGILYTWHTEQLRLVSKVELGDQIKAPVAVEECYEHSHRTIYAYVISYSKFLHKVDILNGTISSCVSVAGASPAEVVFNGNNVICTTIKGTVECFSKDSLAKQWKLQMPFPIFSSVCLEERNNDPGSHQYGYVGDVHGNVIKIQLKSGIKIASLSLDEPIFAKCQISNDELLIATQKGSLFIVDVKNFIFIRKLVFPGSTFVRGPVVRNEGTFLMSTDGWMCCLRNNSTEVVRLRVCPEGNNVFSMPQFATSRAQLPNSPADPSMPSIVVGSRDNWLRYFHSFSF